MKPIFKKGKFTFPPPCPKCTAPTKLEQKAVSSGPRPDPLEAYRPIGPGGNNWSPTHLLPLGGPPMTLDELRTLHMPMGPNPNIIKTEILVCTKCDWTSEKEECSSA